MSNFIAVGEEAPDFSLPSTSGQEVQLSSFRGKENVLLAFFPLAFTGTCTVEVNEFSKDYQQYRSRGVTVLPISVDSAPTLAAFKEKEGLGLDLLSDFHRLVSAAYGTLDLERNSSRRAYVLIDREGKVRWAHAEEKGSNKRDTAELLSRIEELD